MCVCVCDVTSFAMKRPPSSPAGLETDNLPPWCVLGSRLVFAICWNQHQQLLLDDTLRLVREYLDHVSGVLDAVAAGPANDQSLLCLVGEAAATYAAGCQAVANALSHLVRTALGNRRRRWCVSHLDPPFIEPESRQGGSTRSSSTPSTTSFWIGGSGEAHLAR